jgi:hypothetical protein
LRKRSGLKSSGSGQYSGSWWTTWMGIPTIVPGFKKVENIMLFVHCAIYKLKKVRRCFLRPEFGKNKQGKSTVAAEEKLSFYHRLNMELDLQSLFGLHVHSCTHWLRVRPLHSPSPHTFLDSYSRALVSKDRRHLFVTPCFYPWFL